VCRRQDCEKTIQKNKEKILKLEYTILLVIIEFQNTIEPKNHSAMAMAIVITACALFFIPTTLIVLGYYTSQPTGSLISPLPETTLSQNAPKTATPSVTPTIAPENQPIIAADNIATKSADTQVAPISGSNITDKVAVIEPNTTESIITDDEVTEDTQIYLSPRPGDKALYSLRSKASGQFTIAVAQSADTIRYIDYSIVNP